MAYIADNEQILIYKVGPVYRQFAGRGSSDLSADFKRAFDIAFNKWFRHMFHGAKVR